MTNIRNQAAFIGRLTRKPVLKDHKDGSATALITIAVKDNFLSKRDGKSDYQTQYIDAQGFVKKDSKLKNRYEKLEKGDLVAVEAHLESNQWKDKTGEKVNSLQIIIDSIDTGLESSAAKAARGGAEDAESAEAEAAPTAEANDVNPY